MLSSREKIGFLLGLLGVAIFAGSLPATRLAVFDLGPWFLTAARTALAGLCSLAALLAMRRPFPPRETWPQLAIVVAGVVIGFPLFTAIGMQTVPASHGGVVLGILPLATAVSAVLITHERPGPGFWIAAVTGSVVVAAFALRNGGGESFALGDALLLLAIISAAVAYAASGVLTKTMAGWEVISWVLAISLPVTLPASLYFFPEHPDAVSATAWGALLYAAVMAQWIGFFAWNKGMAMGGISRVSQVQLVQPFFTVGIAAVANNETIDLETVLFAVAVVAIVALGTRMRVKRG